MIRAMPYAILAFFQRCVKEYAPHAGMMGHRLPVLTLRDCQVTSIHYDCAKVPISLLVSNAVHKYVFALPFCPHVVFVHATKYGFIKMQQRLRER